MKHWRTYFLAFCAFALIGHFMLVLSYLVVPNNLSVFYVYPFFHQNWNLFVPPPDSNYNLYVYNQKNNKQSIDLFSEITVKHQKNRLSGNQPLIMALSNSIHYFEKEAEEKNFTGGRVGKNEKFAIIEKFVTNYLKSNDSLNIENAKIIICVSSIKKGKQRVYFN